MSRAEAERNLINWARYNGRRDEFVRQAHRVGIEKMRIHALTGLSRATIDRILNQPQGDTAVDITLSFIEADLAALIDQKASTKDVAISYETDQSGVGLIVKVYDEGGYAKSYKVTLEEI